MNSSPAPRYSSPVPRRRRTGRALDDVIILPHDANLRAGVSRVDFSSDGGMSWHEIELGKDEGNIQFPTMTDARMAYKAPIEPKDVDAIFRLSHQHQRRELGGEVVGLLSS
jgi:hypothetical protein